MCDVMRVHVLLFNRPPEWTIERAPLVNVGLFYSFLKKRIG